MSKIVKLSEDCVCIGLDDGSIREVHPDDLAFTPQVGDEVEIYETKTQTIVQKKGVNQSQGADNGIHINVSNNQTTPPTMVVSGKIVNKVVDCVLAILLGGFGIHKFYAGRIGAGICYLLFFWTLIPLFIAWIEAIVALCKPADASGHIVV